MNGEQEMKPHIIKERCAADPRICPPMKDCPMQAFSYVEDDAEPIGGRVEIDLEKCSGCGLCADICCGSCIEMNNNF
jgi:formate hydrogenlyase subunit 6/NADH:ubiquinone oxidoreductase subunit I